jgi:hypothetical protein
LFAHASFGDSRPMKNYGTKWGGIFKQKGSSKDIDFSILSPPLHFSLSEFNFIEFKQY